ncbi:glycosyltransferase family 2 protein [Cryptosporangium sp. NPDC048952]|uniref:glycosyltransferase family 2 protein n=1 Tax=Cryptosporangium sp. NPDC048952 TaxID=3363961 RepID=UPI00371384BB
MWTAAHGGDEPRIAAILINYNSASDIEARLASPALAGQRIVLIDNASEPDRLRVLAAQYDTELILSATNRGFAGGVNLGFERLRELGNQLPVLLLNPDVHLGTAERDSLVDKLTDEKLDGTSPLLVEPSGRLQVGVAGTDLSVASTAAYFLLFAHLFPGWRGLFLTRRQCRRGGSVSWLCAACLLLDPTAITRYGRWPEDEIVYAEDVAWGTAASARGARFALDSAVEVLHEVGGSGAGPAWSGALKRLCRRRLGSRGGGLAAAIISTGIALRRGVGRVVP